MQVGSAPGGDEKRVGDEGSVVGGHGVGLEGVFLGEAHNVGVPGGWLVLDGGDVEDGGVGVHILPDVLKKQRVLAGQFQWPRLGVTG